MRKKLLYIASVLLVSATLCGCSLVKLNVIEEQVTVEYGKKISLNAGEYLSNEEDVLSEVKVSSDIKNEEGKEYPAVGEYTLKFQYKKKAAEVKVSVVDTVKPEFVDFKEIIEVYQNGKVDSNALYTAKDLSKVTIDFDDSKVDYAVGGSYAATVTATDSSDNAETKDVTVNVIPVTVSLNTTSSTINTGSTVQLEATVNIPDSKATFTSSDGSVATVDENGLVTGIKAGTTTIFAELNGVKAECVVTVKAVKATTSNKNNGSSNNKPSATTNSSKPSNSGSNTTANNGGSKFNNTVPEIPTPKTSKEAFDLINAERVKLGLQPAVWDAECERIALIRAEEVAPMAVPTHDGFDKFQAENRKLGECVAWGYGSAQGAVNGWMNSSAHKEILMMENRVYLAVAYCNGRWVAINSR